MADQRRYQWWVIVCSKHPDRQPDFIGSDHFCSVCDTWLDASNSERREVVPVDPVPADKAGLLDQEEKSEALAERLEGTDPLTVEEAETALTIIDYWLEAVEKAGVGMEVGRGEYEPLRAKLRARLAREDAG